MQEISLVEGRPQHLHHRHPLHRMQIRRPRPKRRPRRKLLRKPKLKSRPLLSYRNNMPKVKGKGKIVESRRPQVRAHEIRRRFHVISILSRSLARKEKIVSTVIDQKTFDASKTSGSGKGGGKTPRSQSPANRTKKIDEPCWHWAKGKCRYGDKCNKRHDPHLFNTAPNTESTSSKATPALLHDDSDDEMPFFKAASSQMKKKVKLTRRQMKFMFMRRKTL